MNISSKVKVAKLVVTSKVGRQLLKGQKHSPAILFGAGVVGVVATTVCASKATLKLDNVIQENELKQEKAKDFLENGSVNYSASDYAHDMSKLKVHLVTDVVKLYAPAVVVGVVSVCALTGSHVILTRRNAGLMAAYAALDKGFTEYRGRVLEFVGPDKERELRFGSDTQEIARDTAKGTVVDSVQRVDMEGCSVYARIYDNKCAGWSPQADYRIYFLRCQRQFANDMLNGRGHIFLNEVYDSLGLSHTPAGAVTGWVLGKGDDLVDFGDFENAFYDGNDGSLLLDFNVDGIIYDLI